MVSEEKLLHLIIIEESPNDAEAIANLLRSAGYVVRHQYAQDMESLATAMDQHVPDLIVCAEGLEKMGLSDVLATLKEHQLETPVILVGEEANEPQVIDALRAGATDLVSFDRPEHLGLVVARERKNLDIRRRLQFFERSYHETERRCRALLDSSRDAIAYVHDGMHIYANQSYLEMFGFDELEEIEGHPIMDMVAPEDHARFKEFLRSYGRSDNQEDELEVECLSAVRGKFNAVMEFAPAAIEGEPCTQIMIRDRMTNDPKLAEKLKYLSKQDMVTGLFNRQYFMEELNVAVNNATSGSGNSTLLYVLIDNFKAVKENVGLAASDLVVKDVADIVREKTGDKGIAARFGDNSFTVLSRGDDVDAATALAESIRHAVEEHIVDVEGRSTTVTCSIGISLVNEAIPSAQEALSRADLACEVARSAGGNRFHLHNPITDEQVSKERDEQWKQLLTEALEQDRFRLVYQPIVSLKGDNREKYEVLLRMQDTDGNEVMPRKFLPVAMEQNMMADIDRWVVHKAIQVLAEHRRQGHDTQFFIKISAESLGDPELPLWINEQIKAAHLQGDALVFEIAEKDVGQHLKNAKAFFKAIRALRCMTSLDHFGSASNSFQIFKHVNANFLKINGSLIHNLASDESNQAMVRSIVELAHSMDRECIAEFVEDASSLTVLYQYGVDYIQGYFLQEPQEALNFDFSEESI